MANAHDIILVPFTPYFCKVTTRDAHTENTLRPLTARQQQTTRKLATANRVSVTKNWSRQGGVIDHKKFSSHLV